MSISLRDIAVWIAIFALAISGMRLGGLLASTAVFLIWLITVLRTLVAVAGKADERLAARGFVVPVFLYVLMLSLVGGSEFQMGNPRLFTSKLLAELGAGSSGK